MLQLDVNTIPFYIKDLSIHRIWYLRGSWNSGFWRTTVCVCVFKFSLKSFFSLLLCSSWTPEYSFVFNFLFPFLSCYIWLSCHDLQFSWDLDSFLAFPKIHLCQFSGWSSLYKGSKSQSKEVSMGLPWWLRQNLHPSQETWVQSLGWEDPLEVGMATHSSILAWRIP